VPQAVFLLFVVVAPAVHLMVLGGLWTVPLTRRGHARALVAAEVTRAWASLEVFVVGTLAAVLQVTWLPYLAVHSCFPHLAHMLSSA
jgi:uncharacterized paraquat-inducible protein A